MSIDGLGHFRHCEFAPPVCVGEFGRDGDEGVPIEELIP
jgi:hypothetical protein